MKSEITKNPAVKIHANMNKIVKDVTIFTTGICRTHFFVGLKNGLDAPDV